MDRRDKDYFDDKMFVFTNKDTKRKMAELASEKDMTLYFIIDESIRDYLDKNGIKTNRKPKRLTLV